MPCLPAKLAGTMAAMRFRAVPLMILLCQSARAQQSGLVTVYAPGSHFKGAGKRALTLAIGYGDMPSRGMLFDGHRKIALLTPGTFVTLRLVAGTHRLNGNKAAIDPADHDTLRLDVASGSHPFVRLTTTSAGAWVVQVIKAHLALATCDEARKEAATTKPLPTRLVQKDARSLLVPSAGLPVCEAHP